MHDEEPCPELLQTIEDVTLETGDDTVLLSEDGHTDMHELLALLKESTQTAVLVQVSTKGK